MKMIRRTMLKFLIVQFAFSYSLTEDATTYSPTSARPTGSTYPPTGSTYPATTSPDPYGCPVGWVQSTEGCFLFHHTGMNNV